MDADEQLDPVDENHTCEREDIQKKAFTKWINNQLATDANSTRFVDDLFEDLRDGVILLRLLEILTGNEYKRENGKMRVHHIGNINKVISILNEHGMKLLSISSNDIVDGHHKLTLALIWSIIQYWQGKNVIKSVAADASQTNIEKFLLSWCQQQTAGYKGVKINDFTHSWEDGLAFNALIHKFHPDLFDYDELLQNAAARNLEHAFSIAKNVFKIDRYLDVEDFHSGVPDSKSILMYVMCLFQQLPTGNIIIEDKDKQDTVTTTRNVTTTVTTTTTTMEDKSPSEVDSTHLLIFQTNMDRILHWILSLEDILNTQDTVVSDDLRLIKEQFQYHEEFMINLTKDQNQIGDVLQQGNQILISTDKNLELHKKEEIKEQMKALNSRWEKLRLISLERQSILHKMLMKLQIEQIESFDRWLSQTEQLIEEKLQIMEQNLAGVEQQYTELAQLQDELVSQQQITESLQNMIIVIDESSSSNEEASKYNSNEIETKLLNLSERWAEICNFVQNRWIELQEAKIEFQQFDFNRNKVDRWLEVRQNEINTIKSELNTNDNNTYQQNIQTIQKMQSEMDDVRQSILSLDNTLQNLSKHYDSSTANVLTTLNDEINSFEKRWSQFVEDVDECSARLRKATFQFETNAKPTSDTTHRTTTHEETKTTVYENINNNVDTNKKPTVDHTLKSEFDISAKKFFDWIDSIEVILDEQGASNLQLKDKNDITQARIQEIKEKYVSYNDQFKSLVYNGNVYSQQLKNADEDSSEHDLLVKTLENRWNGLHEKISLQENKLEQLKFEDEYQALAKHYNEYKLWLDSSSTTNLSTEELQFKLNDLQAFENRLQNLRSMADRFDTHLIHRTDDLIRASGEMHSQLRERIVPIERMDQHTTGTTGFQTSSYYQSGTSAAQVNPVETGANERIISVTRTSASTSTGGAGAGVGVSSSSSSNSGAGGTLINLSRRGDRIGETGQTSSLGSSIGDNGSLFTLTNIYTFGGRDGSLNSLASGGHVNATSDVLNQSTQNDGAFYGQSYRETQSSSTISRRVHTSATDSYGFGTNGNYGSSHVQHVYETPAPSTTRPTHGGGNNLSILTSTFVDMQCKVRIWLEHTERSLQNDRIIISDTHSVNVQRKLSRDLLEQAAIHERHLGQLNELARQYYSSLSFDASRTLRDELNSYASRLHSIKINISERLARLDAFGESLANFEKKVNEIKLWIHKQHSNLSTNDTSARGLENQIGRNQLLQNETRDIETVINTLNREIIYLVQGCDDTLANRLNNEMEQLNKSWDSFVNSNKAYTRNLEDALRRHKALQEEFRQSEEWIAEKDRETSMDDSSIFYHEQLRQKVEEYKRHQSELTLKERSIRSLAEQVRRDIHPSASHDLLLNLESLISKWSILQKRVDNKVAFYTDLYGLHETLKDLLDRENLWLDSLEQRIYKSESRNADVQEASEERDSLENFLRSHSKDNYNKIRDIYNILQAKNISLTSTYNKITRFQTRWVHLEEEVVKRIEILNALVSDYQQSGRQIAAMQDWIRYTDTILTTHLRGNTYAGDVPSENTKLIAEFNQYETLLNDIDERIQTLQVTGKAEAARRLEQQYNNLKIQFEQLHNKFRQFQKPSDFQPKYEKVRKILQDIESNMHRLERHSDDLNEVHDQLQETSKIYDIQLDIKHDVEYVIRTGRQIVEKGQTNDPHQMTREIDYIKNTYNNLGSKITALKTKLNSIERSLRKFREEYSLIHEWFVKADQEIREIENIQASKNIREDNDWIRTTRNYIKRLDGNFDKLKQLEDAVEKASGRPMHGLHEKVAELRRQIEQLDRRLRDRLKYNEVNSVFLFPYLAFDNALRNPPPLSSTWITHIDVI